MALTLDATVGGASANTYLANADADALMDGRQPNTAWVNLPTTEDDQNRALAAACVILGRQRWKGYRASTTQALAWPRSYVPDPDPVYGGDAYLADDAIPAAVKRAQVELAYLILSGDFDAGPTGLEGLKSLKVGAIEIEADSSAPRASLPESVRREIAPFLAGGENTVRLVRG